MKRDYLVGRDGTNCLYDNLPLDLEHCVIDHLDNNPENNNDWNLALVHQKCNIDKIENYDYQFIAKEKIKQNQLLVYAPRLEDKNETVSTEVSINVNNRQLTKQKLMEWTIDGQKIEHSETMNSVTYLCIELTGHGSQKCVRDYIAALCSSAGPFMIVKDEDGKKMIQRRTGN